MKDGIKDFRLRVLFYYPIWLSIFFGPQLFNPSKFIRTSYWNTLQFIILIEILSVSRKEFIVWASYIFLIYRTLYEKRYIQ
jgi:hypothetical protein